MFEWRKKQLEDELLKGPVVDNKVEVKPKKIQFTLSSLKKKKEDPQQDPSTIIKNMLDPEKR